MNPILSKFYKKTKEDKLTSLVQAGYLTKELAQQLLHNNGLTDSIAEHMIENQISLYELPFGVVPHLLVNNTPYVVPMVTEEPSVIAAASNASKWISQHGGVTATVHSRYMIGQIALQNVPNSQEATEYILHHQEELFSIAQQAHPSIVARGGGLKAIDVHVRRDDTHEFLIVYLTIDTKEAMGANIVNTICEALVSPLESWTKGNCLMAILSNKATESLVTATCTIPSHALETEQIERIVAASHFARLDTYRATTHNKGIMNGIDAVVMATGNDWRAIEAGAHAYASHSGTYQPLATWRTNPQGDLVGELTIPMAVGTVGGSIAIHPGAQVALHLLRYPNAHELACIIASIGLAQNFAALRALVTDGIQKGHMRLQAKSLAIASGAKDEEIDVLAARLAQEKQFTQQTAKELLHQLRSKTPPSV